MYGRQNCYFEDGRVLCLQSEFNFMIFLDFRCFLSNIFVCLLLCKINIFQGQEVYFFFSLNLVFIDMVNEEEEIYFVFYDILFLRKILGGQSWVDSRRGVFNIYGRGESFFYVF